VEPNIMTSAPPQSSSVALSIVRNEVHSRRCGFTLAEVLMALAILGVVMSITMPAVIEVQKRSQHAEAAMQGAEELRYVTALISQVVRSAPQTPEVRAGGLELLIAPKDLAYATVGDTTLIDLLRGVKGSRSDQRVLIFANIAGSAAVYPVFASDARPAGEVTASDYSTYFVDGSSLPIIDLDELFTVGDTITIPATPYGGARSSQIATIGNAAGNKTITLEDDLGVNVPNDTRIAATSGRRLLFSVQSNGELRYFADHRDLSSYTVIARDIDPSPLVDPADSASGETVPFTLSDRNVMLNLQKLPAGTLAGRTVQGAITTIYVRTNPLSL